MNAKYSVLLRHDLKPEDVDFFRNVGNVVVSRDGVERCHLYCTQLDSAQLNYLHVTVISPDEELEVPLQIPHYMVFLISDADEQRRPIGFMV